MTYEKRISNVNEFVNNVANLYTDPLRVLMEYIDNSLDSADDIRNSEDVANYPRPIKVNVEIHKKSRLKDCKVTILDNCSGMGRKELTGIVREIGNSGKKNAPWLNGRFGFGVHAYASCCETVTFITRKKDGETLQISIDRHSPEVNDEAVVSNKLLPVETGTLVILSDFKDRQSWNQIKTESIRQMIEEHFEFKLRERNLSIVVSQEGNGLACNPFDYNSIEGIPFHKTIQMIEREDGRSNCKKIQKLDPPIEVFLRVSKSPVSRPVLFFANGRRICKVVEEKSFMNVSSKKMQLWGHPHLVGYLDVKAHLEPQLDRTGFNTRPWQTRAVFEELANLEDEVAKALDDINEATRNESLDDLSSLISSILADLAKEDNLRFRAKNQKGSELGETVPSALGGIEEGTGSSEGEREGGGGGKGGGTDDGTKTGIKPDLVGDVPTATPGTGGPPIPSPTETGEKIPSTQEKPKPGFDVRFHPMKPPEEDGRPMRSEFAGGEIWIYSEHPEFSQRKSESKDGKIKLTTELISYIAGEVATHYRDEWYSKNKLQLIENDRKRVMQELVEFILHFEKKMKPFANKTADEVGILS